MYAVLATNIPLIESEYRPTAASGCILTLTMVPLRRGRWSPRINSVVLWLEMCVIAAESTETLERQTRVIGNSESRRVTRYSSTSKPVGHIGKES